MKQIRTNIKNKLICLIRSNDFTKYFQFELILFTTIDNQVFILLSHVGRMFYAMWPFMWKDNAKYAVFFSKRASYSKCNKHCGKDYSQ